MYVMNVMDIPERLLKGVERLVNEFLWEDEWMGMIERKRERMLRMKRETSRCM